MNWLNMCIRAALEYNEIKKSMELSKIGKSILQGGREMTDERIKEEYDVWVCDIECTENERRFLSQYPAIYHPTAVGFYAGFRTAERLAKIEALEEVLEATKRCYMAQSVWDEIDSMISELKEVNR